MPTPPPTAQNITKNSKTSVRWDPIGEPSNVRTFRIDKKHLNKLAEGIYAGNGSILMRLLLRDYFDDKLPGVKMKFIKIINDSGRNNLKP